jgi:hypothetical protein
MDQTCAKQRYHSDEADPRVLACVFAGLLCCALSSHSVSAGTGMASERMRRAQFRLVQAPGPGLAVEAITGVSGTSIPLKLTLPGAAADPAAGSARRFLMFRGIPEPFTLSSGFRTRNAWVVSADHASGLRLNVPRDYSGAFAIEVLLYRGETENPERQMLSVEISTATRPAAAPQPEVSASPPATDKPAETPREVAAVPAAELELLSRGEQHLRNGNIVFARALFEELAARGSARGAFAVAQTYDPAVLEQIGAVGVQGDSEQAKHWYRKAAELGNVVPVDMMSALKKERPAE